MSRDEYVQAIERALELIAMADINKAASGE